MNKLNHVREKAIKLRNKGMSLNDIYSQLSMPKTTVYYWIKDINISVRRKHSLAGSMATKRKYAKLHDISRKNAEKMWDEYLQYDEDFKLFLMLYWCEGYKKTKQVVSVSNSDVSLLKLADTWIRGLTNRENYKIEGMIQYHEDQSPEELLFYWQKNLGFEKFRLLKKNNSGKLKGRNWRSEYGVCQIRLSDAYLKTKIDYWIERLRESLIKVSL